MSEGTDKPEFGPFEEHTPAAQNSPLAVGELEREEAGEWGPDWDNESDFEELFEEDDTKAAVPESKPIGASFKPQAGESTVLAAAGKTVDVAQAEFQKRRKVAIKIINESTKAVLEEPQWDFEDGKTEILPDLRIKSGGTGEAVFKGSTLKGCLSYKIKDPRCGDTGYHLVVVFKVLHWRGIKGKISAPVEVFEKIKAKFTKKRSEKKSVKFGIKRGRENQVGVKVVKRSELFFVDKKTKKEERKKSSKIYEENKGAKKLPTRWYHTYPVSDPSKVKNIMPPLIFRYSISETGEAEMKIYVEDAYPEA